MDDHSIGAERPTAEMTTSAQEAVSDPTTDEPVEDAKPAEEESAVSMDVNNADVTGAGGEDAMDTDKKDEGAPQPE